MSGQEGARPDWSRQGRVGRAAAAAVAVRGTSLDWQRGQGPCRSPVAHEVIHYTQPLAMDAITEYCQSAVCLSVCLSVSVCLFACLGGCRPVCLSWSPP